MYEVKNPKDLIPSVESIANLARLILAPRINFPKADISKANRASAGIKKHDAVISAYQNYQV